MTLPVARLHRIGGQRRSGTGHVIVIRILQGLISSSAV
ncbi:hypothetical protein F652_2013 [Enterobacteriaceae bacterium bta3-1]|nr:hypothetical protein F652_2013 [Enterobacteriaceae bacterium bta3-1]